MFGVVALLQLTCLLWVHKYWWGLTTRVIVSESFIHRQIMEPGWRVWSFQSMVEDGYDFGITKPKIISSSPSTSSTTAARRTSPIASPDSEAVVSTLDRPPPSADVKRSNGVDASNTLPLSKLSAGAAVTSRKDSDNAAGISSSHTVTFHRPPLQDMGKEQGQEQGQVVKGNHPSFRHWAWTQQ